MRLSRTLVGVAAVTGLLAAALTGTAQADTNTATGTALAAVGSDTIDEVTNQLSLLAALSPDLANYTATPAGTIDTTANFPGAAARAAGATCVFTRPNGSGAGKNTLSAAIRGAANGGSANVKECVGIARSSNNTFPTGTNAVPAGTMARIPLGLDAVAPAVRNNSGIGKRFTMTLLKSLYTRNGVAGTADCLGMIPLVPQGGSGSRGFWATAMGVTDYDFSGTGPTGVQPPPAATVQTWGSCVTGGAPNPQGANPTLSGGGQPGDRIGTPTGLAIQEHSGTALSDNRMMVPYSIGQYIVQGSGIAADNRGSAVLASVDFLSAGNAVVNANVRHPWTINGGNGAPGFSGGTNDLTRVVYFFLPHVIYDAAYTPPAGADGFASTSAADRDRFRLAFANGAASEMCNTNTINLFGFSPVATCGTPELN